jgi:hypothetical protein
MIEPDFGPRIGTLDVSAGNPTIRREVGDGGGDVIGKIGPVPVLGFLFNEDICCGIYVEITGVGLDIGSKKLESVEKC